VDDLRLLASAEPLIVRGDERDSAVIDKHPSLVPRLYAVSVLYA
jgi:hypothetical protein